VLGAAGPGRWRHALIAAAVTVGVHGAFWLSTHARISSKISASRQVVRPPLRDRYVDLEDVPAGRKQPEPRRAEPPPRAAPVRHRQRSPASAAPTAPAAPARAAAIVASEPAPDAPEDLTGDTVVVGSATSYAGGLTTADGRGTGPDGTRDGTNDGPASAQPARSSAPDRSSAVALGEQSWSCPWPRDADAETIDEQTVVIRVVVAADGRAESAEVLSNPGHGFAEAATACALHTRFTPSRDRAGREIRAKSPPIKVRFTR
jgi:protein TonB